MKLLTKISNIFFCILMFAASITLFLSGQFTLPPRFGLPGSLLPAPSSYLVASLLSLISFVLLLSIFQPERFAKTKQALTISIVLALCVGVVCIKGFI